ncbi:chromate transporter [Breznakibacter xylanolyticus]|uniref:Chromate transporter n=1 Tax=Breznakibacter xylanolyticus TaxID=990 RepID=A0A2W7N5M1_9BACT|nr:chromate transporter [Breznakibacter xylanolyticus]PZX15370.1 chromate transporter [Breznakibacter xylanolyticus]
MAYLQLFYVFFKVGILGFGGGYAILPMIYQEIQTFGFITHDDFSNLVALSQVTPGPIAINAATYVGFKTAGTLGATVATVAVTLPSLMLIVIVSHVLSKFKENVVIQGILKGIRPATIGLIGSAFIFLGQAAFMNSTSLLPDAQLTSWLGAVQWEAVIIFVIIFALMRLTKLGAILLTLVGALLGLCLPALHG